MFILKGILRLIEFWLSFLFRRFVGTARLALLWQEYRYYRRYFREHNIRHPFELHEKWFIYGAYASETRARKWFTLVKPETILGAWKRAITNHWTSSAKRKRKPCRPPITKGIRE